MAVTKLLRPPKWPPMELWWKIGGHRWISLGCQLGYLHNFFAVRFILLISPHTEKIQMGVGTIRFVIECSTWKREPPNLGILF